MKIKKQYLYACSCGCDNIAHTFSGRKARREAAGEITEIWSIFRESGLVVADCYDLDTARRIAESGIV